jgi:ubiquinone biosynthesis protein
MGMKAVYAKIKTNLPFWGEKLPELPDLVYDFLKSNQKSQTQQAAFMLELSQQQQLNNKRLIRSVFAGSTLICSIILFGFGYQLYSSAMLAVSALLVVAIMRAKTEK